MGKLMDQFEVTESCRIGEHRCYPLAEGADDCDCYCHDDWD